MTSSPVQFLKVTQETVRQFLDKAQKRIVIAKAGYKVEEINTLLDLVKGRRIRCDVYVDANENSVRYGFGEQDAITILKENVNSFNVQIANHLRWAIVIVDENVLLYSPVALSWEEMPPDLDFPNGLIGGNDLAVNLLRQIDGKTINIEGITIPVQPAPITQKTPEEVNEQLSETIQKLKENPPVDPAKLRETTFYRNTFKLLKMTISGVNIKNKSLDLRPFNSLIPQANERLRASWHVLTRDDVAKLKAIAKFFKEKDGTLQKFTFDARRFGTLIETKKKADFEKAISSCLEALKNELSKQNAGQSETDKKSLIDLLNESRTGLTQHLYQQALSHKDCWDSLFQFDRSLQRKMKNGEIPKKQAVREAVESFVDFRLRFPTAEDMLDLIKVDFDYYDVSDELLSKDEFVEILKDCEIKVREYEMGYAPVK